MYRDIFDKKQVKFSEIKSIQDIEQLPTTSKLLFRSFPEADTYQHEYKNRYIWNHTSGSTGIPFRYAMSSFYIHTKENHALKYSDFSKYRFLVWNGIPLSTIVNTMKVVGLGVNHSRKNFKYISFEELKNPKKVLKKIADYEPDVIEGSTTVLIELAREYEFLKQDFLVKIPYINIRGEPVSQTQREYLQMIFGGEVYVRYGVGETGVVGVECRAKDGFHILEESYIVEIVDENNKQVPPGKSGRVLLTFFYNDVMPFIRYDVGDYGTIITEPCSCGIPGKRIVLSGRTNEVLVCGSQVFGPEQIEVLLSDFGQYILRFQIAKISQSALEIRIVPAQVLTAQVKDSITKMYKDLTGLTVSIVVVNELPILGGGKNKIFVDEAR